MHCQVLTANLGHILDVKGTEQGLTDFKGSSTMTFEQYRYYVQTEVFSALPDQVKPRLDRQRFYYVSEFIYVLTKYNKFL